MNGIEIDKRLETLSEFEDLEYTDVGAFCINAWLNKSKAFASKFLRIKAPNLKEQAEILERKIKESNFDDEAVEIAKLLLELEQLCFLDILDDKTSKFKTTVREQIARYKWTAVTLKSIQQFLQLTLIIGAASVPLILSYPSLPREISFSISIVVAVSAALLNFYKFQDHINFQQAAAEKMQLEYSLYVTDRGIYKDLGSGAAIDRFMDEIDKLRQETNELSLSLGKTAQDQIQDQLLRVSKSIPEIHHVHDAH